MNPTTHHEAMTDTIYEIINPSDALTLVAPSFIAGAATVALLGGGQYGIEGTPILFGWKDFFKEHGIPDLTDYIVANYAVVADCLDTVALGKKADRQDYDDAIRLMTPEARRAFIAARNDRRRSSLNDIEGRAHELATHLRKKYSQP